MTQPTNTDYKSIEGQIIDLHSTSWLDEDAKEPAVLLSDAIKALQECYAIARQEEREEFIAEIDRRGNFWTNKGNWQIPTDKEMAENPFKAYKFGKVEILNDLKKFLTPNDKE